MWAGLRARGVNNVAYSVHVACGEGRDRWQPLTSVNKPTWNTQIEPSPVTSRPAPRLPLPTLPGQHTALARHLLTQEIAWTLTLFRVLPGCVTVTEHVTNNQNHKALHTDRRNALPAAMTHWLTTDQLTMRKWEVFLSKEIEMTFKESHNWCIYFLITFFFHHYAPGASLNRVSRHVHWPHDNQKNVMLRSQGLKAA